jgi:hypothetical protein
VKSINYAVLYYVIFSRLLHRNTTTFLLTHPAALLACTTGNCAKPFIGNSMLLAWYVLGAYLDVLLTLLRKMEHFSKQDPKSNTVTRGN